jgi:hypothetical protein
MDVTITTGRSQDRHKVLYSTCDRGEVINSDPSYGALSLQSEWSASYKRKLSLHDGINFCSCMAHPSLSSYCAGPGRCISMQYFRRMTIGRGNLCTLKEPAPLPICPPQIPHHLTCDRTQFVTVGIQQLTP